MANKQKRTYKTKRKPQKSLVKRLFARSIFGRSTAALFIAAVFVFSIGGFVVQQMYLDNEVQAATKRSKKSSKKSKKIKTLSKSNSEKLIKSMKKNEKKAKEAKDRKKASQKKGKISSSSSAVNADRNVEIDKARERVKKSDDKKKATKATKDRKEKEDKEKKTRDDAAAAKAFQKAVVAKDQEKYKKILADTEKKARDARLAADRARKAEATAKAKVAETAKKEKEAKARRAAEIASVEAKNAERAAQARATEQRKLDRQIAQSTINQERLARDMLLLASGDAVAASQINAKRTAKDLTELSKIEEQAAKVQEASVTLREANRKAKETKNKANQFENIARGLTPGGKVVPLKEAGCNDRGREWKNGKCQNTCKDGNKTTASYHNFCTGSVTTTISKSQCENELGRKWVANTGCARKSDTKQNPCKDPSELYVSTATYDYCGSRQANVAKIVPVAPQNIQKPAPANIQINLGVSGQISTGGVNMSKLGESRATDCVSYVGDTLLRSGFDYGAVMSGYRNKLANGGRYVDVLTTKPGWTKNNQAVPGAVVSFTKRGHVAIVTKVNKTTGEITVMHANWPRGSTAREDTFSAAKASEYGFVYAVYTK